MDWSELVPRPLASSYEGSNHRRLTTAALRAIDVRPLGSVTVTVIE
jgi:hypothetical protein